MLVWEQASRRGATPSSIADVKIIRGWGGGNCRLERRTSSGGTGGALTAPRGAEMWAQSVGGGGATPLADQTMVRGRHPLACPATLQRRVYHRWRCRAAVLPCGHVSLFLGTCVDYLPPYWTEAASAPSPPILFPIAPLLTFSQVSLPPLFPFFLSQAPMTREGGTAGPRPRPRGDASRTEA